MNGRLAGLEFGEELFWEPIRAVPPDAWAGHIAAAFWLVKAACPAMLVELGTHSGNSYFAFCQAVAALDLSTRCFAVDTWRGDEHAGWYSGEIFDDVASLNQTLYSRFSALLRTTFNDARPYFADGSVDLLHIDGMHSYEAVRGDFDTWRSAMSQRGVVLLHDINVRERDFGVWRLWEELSAEFPSFAFDHSHGLGVLGVGSELPPALARLFALRHEPEAAAVVRRTFSARGEAFQRRVQMQLQDARIAALIAAAEASGQAHSHDLEARARDHAANVSALEQQLHEAARLVHWKDELIAAREHVIGAQRELLRATNEGFLARDAAIAGRDRIIEVRDARVRESVRAGEHIAREWSAKFDDVVRRSASDVDQLRQESARLAAAHADACASRDRLDRKYRKARKQRTPGPIRRAGKLWRRMLGRGDRHYAVEVTPAPAQGMALQVHEAIGATAPPTDTGPTSAAAPDPKAAMRAILATRLDAFLASGARLQLPDSEQPDVSIILVLFNQAELTFGCLTSILESRLDATHPVEVVVLDNGSVDATGALLERLDGARVVRCDENLHFLRGVNRAVQHARGRNLLLLNNDAQLLPGAVQAALRTLAAEPMAGAVGGRIILPDGTLQEAGSIVWNDGTCLGYGRGRSPNDPEFMFRRDVDYCSGAFLLTPTALFRELGGFDERYAPAYYEETDYCVRLWQRSLRVVYEPEAAIVHFEFGSAAEGAHQALELQGRNWRRFAASHADWLRGQLPPLQVNELTARTARPARGKRVLMLEDRIPKPALGAGYPRSRDILHELVAAGAEVTFYPMYRHRESWPEVRATVGPAVETFILGSADQLGPFLESRRNYYDAFLVCRFHNMKQLVELEVLDPSLIGDARVIYDAEAVFARRDVLREQTAERQVTPEEASAMVADEVGLTRLAHTVVSVSDAERQLFLDHGVASVVRLGHAIETRPTPASFTDRTEFLFMGAVHDDNSPNADSLRWFAAAVLPLLRQRLHRKDLRLTVVGLNDAATIAALDGKELNLVGSVEDLVPRFNQARVFVAPTRFAAGIPHKVHQAAMLGVPIVATSLIAAQVGWSNGEELLAAEEAAGFADACARAFTDETLWQRLRSKALERCRLDCSPERFRHTVRELLEQVPLRRLLDADARPPQLAAPPVQVYVGRDAGSDYSASVPFGYLPPPASRPASVAVLCHLFHAELAAEFQHYLRNIPVPADLFISTDTEAKRAALAEAFYGWAGGEVELRVMPNQGRDIAPKLVGFRDVNKRYQLVLHLHSKMSRHNELLAPWRTFLLENLLGSRAIVRSVFEAFARLPQIGMIFPQYYEYVRHWQDWGPNFVTARQLAGRFGVSLRADSALDFPAGSMFWARSAALRPLIDLDLAVEDFPAETGQTDGTLAHAIERLYLYSCERAGYGWLKIANPTLYFDTDTIVSIRSAEDLDRFVAKHCFWLTGPTAPPPATEAPPVRSAVPPGLLSLIHARGPLIREPTQCFRHG